MKRKYLAVLVCTIGIVLLANSAWAGGRPDKDWKSWFGHFAGGYSAVTGESGKLVDDGWNLSGGATYWPEDWGIGLVFDLGYNTYDIKSEALQGLSGVTSGSVDIWSISADVLWSPPTSGVGVNLLAGIGGYYLDGSLGQPGVYTGVICSPWWYWCYPGLIPGTVVVASESTTKFGWNVGAALTFNVGLGSQIYIEARYTQIETSREATEIIPLVLGYRW